MLVLGRPVNWKTSFIYAELLLLKSLKVVAQMHCSKRSLMWRLLFFPISFRSMWALTFKFRYSSVLYKNLSLVLIFLMTFKAIYCLSHSLAASSIFLQCIPNCMQKATHIKSIPWHVIFALSITKYTMVSSLISEFIRL